jgi:hypothetical protein
MQEKFFKKVKFLYKIRFSTTRLCPPVKSSSKYSIYNTIWTHERNRHTLSENRNQQEKSRQNARGNLVANPSLLPVLRSICPHLPLFGHPHPLCGLCPDGIKDAPPRRGDWRTRRDRPPSIPKPLRLDGEFV